MKKSEEINAKVPGGKGFDDMKKYQEGRLPTKIRVAYGSAVDSVQIVYDEEALAKHGGNGGRYTEGAVGDGKYIKKLRAACGMFGGVKVLTALAFYDQDDRLVAGNERSGEVYELTAGEGECICSIYGETVKAGGIVLISGIGIYTCPLPDMNDMFGSIGSTIADSMGEAMGKFKI